MKLNTKIKIYSILFLFLITSITYSQRPDDDKSGIVKGIVRVTSGDPVEYATVSIYSSSDSSLMVSGRVEKRTL